LRRELTWLFALKVAALALLWWLFFSPAQRVAVDADSTSRRFRLTAAAAPDGAQDPATATAAAPPAATTPPAAGTALCGGNCR